VRRRSILIAVWLAGTVLATSLAWSAVSLVGARVGEQQAAATDLVVAERAPSTQGAGSPSTTTTAVVVTEVARGGQASFTCVDGEPALVDASPNLGWERDTRAPDGQVWFDHDGDDSAILATCEAGVPIVEVSEDDYDEDEPATSTTVATTAAPPATTAPAATAPPTSFDDHGADDDHVDSTDTTFDDHGGDDGGGGDDDGGGDDHGGDDD
jgi:hypothetical protein